MRTLVILMTVLAVCLLAGQAQQGILVGAKAADGTMVYKLIQVNYLDLQALCTALGGTVVNLYPTPMARQQPNQPLPYLLGAPAVAGNPAGSATTTAQPVTPLSPGGLNRGAPLAPLVPAGVTDIVGIQ